MEINTKWQWDDNHFTGCSELIGLQCYNVMNNKTRPGQPFTQSQSNFATVTIPFCCFISYNDQTFNYAHLKKGQLSYLPTQSLNVSLTMAALEPSTTLLALSITRSTSAWLRPWTPDKWGISFIQSLRGKLKKRHCCGHCSSDHLQSFSP